MAVIDNTLTRMATAQYQEQYVPGFTKNYRNFNEKGIIDKMISTGARTAKIRGRLLWDIRNTQRIGVGYAPPTTSSLTHLTSGTENTVNIGAVDDQIYMRQVVAGQELRGEDGPNGGELAYKFFSSMAQIFVDANEVFWQNFIVNFLREGFGTIATVTGGSTGVVASGATITLAVDNVLSFAPGNIYSKLAADGTTVEAYQLQAGVADVKSGAGNITFTNLADVSTSAITNSGFFANPYATVSGKSMGLGFIVDDGAIYADYPRNLTSAGFVTLARASYPNALQSIVFNKTGEPGGSVPITYDVLDDIVQRLEEDGDVEVVDAPVNNDDPGIGANYELIMTTAHRMALQVASRSLGRSYTLGVETEDQSLRRQNYRGLKFCVSKLLPANTLYAINGRDFALEVGEPTSLGADSSDMFTRIPGTDTMEFCQVVRWQILGMKLNNQVKLLGYSGRAVGS